MVEKYMIIEIWTDVVCPWCAIGRARLDAALAGFDHADQVEVVLRSFQLDPSAPVVHDGSAEPMVDVLARRYGVSRDDAAAMMKRTEGIAAGEGLVMHMETTRHSNTFDAHRLLHLAEETSGPHLQKRLNADLMAAYFEHGEDVSDHHVLRTIARAAGLDASEVDEVLAGYRYADAVEADARQARAYGATGVPFFVIDRKYGVSGAQPADVFSHVLDRVWAQAQRDSSAVAPR
jgi:predicted DsbA family dithiol-disulfide isomerase